MRKPAGAPQAYSRPRYPRELMRTSTVPSVSEAMGARMCGTWRRPTAGSSTKIPEKNGRSCGQKTRRAPSRARARARTVAQASSRFGTRRLRAGSIIPVSDGGPGPTASGAGHARRGPRRAPARSTRVDRIVGLRPRLLHRGPASDAAPGVRSALRPQRVRAGGLRAGLRALPLQLLLLLLGREPGPAPRAMGGLLRRPRAHHPDLL